jgi:hypothetical protein
MSSSGRRRRRQGSTTAPQPKLRPAAAELRLYVVDDLSMAAPAARYRVSRKRVRAWLVEAGIPIRTKKESGRRRQLSLLLAAELCRELRR